MSGKINYTEKQLRSLHDSVCEWPGWLDGLKANSEWLGLDDVDIKFIRMIDDVRITRMAPDCQEFPRMFRNALETWK